MSHGGDIYRNKVNMDYSVNLNPLGQPEDVLNEVKASLKLASHYPDINQEDIRNKLAEMEGLDSSFVYAGNGASELILAVVRALSPKKALIYEPAFSGYEFALNALNLADHEKKTTKSIEMIRYLLSEENGFKLSEEAIDAVQENVDFLCIADPMNPIGQNIDENVLISILEKTKKIRTYVLLDESFLFMSEKADSVNDQYGIKKGIIGRAELIKSYDNLIIIRSLTKLLAVPGIRVGYVLSDPDNIRKIKRQLPEWNLSVTSEAAIRAGVSLIREGTFVRKTLDVIRTEREFLSRSLREMGIKVFDSDTSFLLFESDVDLYNKLLERGVLIRDCSDFVGLRRGLYRIAVKSHEENEEFVRILNEIEGNK